MMKQQYTFHDYPHWGRPFGWLGPYGDMYPIGIDPNFPSSRTDILPLRELAMMSIMERLTDKPEWERKVFDQEIVDRWRKEALAIPDTEFMALTEKPLRVPVEGIMTDKSFDYCIRELRSKAKYYQQSAIIPTLDACAVVAKSDKLVSGGLHEALSSAFDKLQADQASSPDWHPHSNDMVQDLVHPSMYPLVYGRTRMIDDEVVGVTDAIHKWAGKGTVVPKGSPENVELQRAYWSGTYQWLPANVKFQPDGSVKVTSYINNLHPNKYPEIYCTIENMIETAIPLWDQCLSAGEDSIMGNGPGRHWSRFLFPENPDDENESNWDPSDPNELADVDVNWDEVPDRYLRPEEDEFEDETILKWKALRKPIIPEPEPEFEDIQYTPKKEMTLAEKFKETGLQVIVKMASVELTPEKPEFPAGGWHVEGQLNEHICATALYYVDCENITPSSLSFRMHTNSDLQQDISIEQDSYSWMESVYGTTLSGGDDECLQKYGSVETRKGRFLAFPNVFHHRVSSFRLKDPTKPGRRRFIALWLVDPHIRIISTANVPPQQGSWWRDALFPSDPTARAATLRSIPPEVILLLKEHGLLPSEDVENDTAVSDSSNAHPIRDLDATRTASLPPELMDMVRRAFDSGEGFLMTEEEAKKHRLALMSERSVSNATAEDAWHNATYSFCEH